MGKLTVISIEHAKKDNGELPLNVATTASVHLTDGDTLSLAQGQDTCVLSFNDKPYRALPVRINDKVAEISVTTLLGTRYAQLGDAFEKVEDKLYRCTFKDWAKLSSLRFPKLNSVVSVATTGTDSQKRTKLIVREDVQISVENKGTCLLQDFDKTIADTTKVVNAQGREVRKYIYLRAVDNYIAE